MFYDIFIQLCKKRGVRPADVSRTLSIGKSTISMWKKQGSTPSTRTLRKLANYFDVDISELIDFDINDNTNTPADDIAGVDGKIYAEEHAQQILDGQGTLTLGQRIRGLRLSSNLTQKQLANSLNLTPEIISSYEQDECTPPLEVFRRLTEIFHVDSDYLLLGLRKENKPENMTDEDYIVQQALAKAGLLSDDGKLSPEGKKVISEFISQNAELLKKVIKEKD